MGSWSRSQVAASTAADYQRRAFLQSPETTSDEGQVHHKLQPAQLICGCQRLQPKLRQRAYTARLEVWMSFHQVQSQLKTLHDSAEHRTEVRHKATVRQATYKQTPVILLADMPLAHALQAPSCNVYRQVGLSRATCRLCTAGQASSLAAGHGHRVAARQRPKDTFAQQ